MPLVRAEVRNEYGYGAPEIYREANKEEPKEILGGVAIAGLIRVLRRLGDLTDFAGEVFHGLQEELMMTSSRSSNLLGRVRRIEAALSPLEKVVLAQRSHLHFAYIPGSDWHARIDCEKKLIAYADVPQFILNSYEDCREPPRLHMLDRFNPSGPGSCFKRYSDPSFFKNASARKGLEDKKESSKFKKLSSWPRNGRMSPGASFPNPGGSMPLRLMSSFDATKRPDLSSQSDFDLRNVSGYSKGDFRQSYSDQSVGKEDDHRTHMEALGLGDNAVNVEVVDETGIQTGTQDLPKSEYIEICFDEFEHERDIFMDAPDAIVVEDETDLNRTRNLDSKLDGKAAELIKQNSQRQTSDSESNASFIFGGCEHNPIAVSFKSSFVAFCCINCISAKDLCNSVSPVDKSLLSHSIGSYSHGGVTDCTNTEYIRDKKSGLPQKPAPEILNDSTAVSVWTSVGLLGLQPSKPTDYGLGDDHGKPDKTKSFRSIDGILNANSSTYQEYDECSSSFQKLRCKISLDDLGFKIHKNGASLTQAGSVLPIAAKKHAEDSRGSAQIFELGNRLLTSKPKDFEHQTKRQLSILPPSSSPPLRHMKIQFQQIDGLDTSKLKLKFPCRITGDKSCSDVFPSFQLTPEVSIAQQHGCSDSSDDDTSHISSASSLDGHSHGHWSESNSEQWESGESPDKNDPDLCNFLSRISCSESISTVMEKGRTGHGDKNYMQGSHSCSSFNHRSLKAINHSFGDHTKHDNLAEPESATVPNPSWIPPVQWYDIKRNLDNALNLKDSMSTICQQPKPAPLNSHMATTEQQRKDSNGQREANKGKNIDEKEDFLQLIRSKSFNLRPTVTTKTTTPSASPANVHVTAILMKANSIRQAVGSDGAEDDDDWSDM